MRKPDNKLRLCHILDALERIAQYLQGVEKAGFEADGKTQDAVVRQLEIIGEAATNLTPELREANPQVPWQLAAATRNRLIHGYFEVDTDIVWAITQNDLSPLKTEIEKILEGLA